MTALTILAVLGTDTDDSREAKFLRAADKAAIQHMKTRRSVVMMDLGPHYDLFHEMAHEIVEWTEKSGRELQQWDDAGYSIHEGRPDSLPSESAAAFYAPQMSAAFYFGLALGMRLSGGAR
jgi:hypothetical protein